MRRALLRAGWGLGLACAGGAATRARGKAATDVDLAWRDTALPAFGTTAWLRAAHHDAAHAGTALAAAARRIQDVEAQMSLFRDDSALARLNRDGRLDDAPADLTAVLHEALRIARASDGAFDPTVQPLWRLRFDAARAGRTPTPAEVERARALVDWRAVGVDPSRRTIRLHRPGMALTLNGIAQGWATDAAVLALRSHGIEHALVDAGEWQPLGRSPEGSAWRLGVQDPRDAQRIVATIAADGRAVACSADDKLAFTPDRREHHVLDPRTGHSPRELSCVVVLAPTATLADALTKPAMMGSARDALRLARRWQVDVITVDKRGRIGGSLAG
jgi:thiamine biosynthesis lipoprotein